MIVQNGYGSVLICDGPGCGYDESSSYREKAEARRDAQEKGWLVNRNGKCYCEVCQSLKIKLD